MRPAFASLRVVSVIAAVLILVSGVTFAALQSQQDTLAGNTVETATANLQLSTDGATYGSSRGGFDFNNLIPGGQAVPAAGYAFYLKNSGGTPLALRMTLSSVPTNPDNVDLSKVNVLVTAVGSGMSAQSFPLQSLAANGGVALPFANLNSGASQQYKLQMSMASDAVSGSSASLGNIDVSFAGTAVSS